MLLNVAPHPGLEALRDGFYMLDSRWRVTYWNAAAERLLGIPREAILGEVLWDAVPRLRVSATREQLERVRDAGAARDFVDPARTPEEGPCLSVHAAPLDDGGVAVHFRDGSEELHLNERYSRLIESIKDGFVAVDADGVIAYVNRNAEHLMRLPRQRMVGSSLWSLLPAEPPEMARAMRRTMKDGKARRLQGITPSGEMFEGRIFDLWIHPLPGGGISLLFAEVSERYEREKELARLAAEAEDASRAKSRFFAAVSHELRTPLNAIIGYGYLLSSEAFGPMPPQARRAAERGSVCAEHLARLVEDVMLLTMAEVQRLPVVPQRVSLADSLAEMVQPLRLQAEAKGLRFALEVPEPQLSVETDPDRLRQLLLTLLSNAVKFTSTGEVRVEARTASDGGPDGDASGSGADSLPAVEILVLDSGPGIAPADRERIFFPFEQLGDPSRTDSIQRGTGLGLTIARELTQLLHGTLTLEERPGGGSVFRLRLPGS